MNPNALAEALAVVSTIDPQTVANSAKVGDYVDMSKYQKVIFYFLLGDMAAETIDCGVYEATDSGGTGAQALKAATQLAAHASNNDNKQIVIEVNAANLSSGFTHVAPRMVTGNTTGGAASAIGLAAVNRYDPANAGDLATVVEIARK